MNIIGIYDNRSNYTFIKYVLSLCEHCSTKSFNITDKNAIKNSQHTDFVIVFLDDISSFLTTSRFNNIPILMISKSVIKDSTIEIIIQQGNNILDTYFFSNFEEEFDSISSTIPNVRLRLQLIKKINYILYKKLYLKDINRFTCGIDRPSIERGDENGY